MPPDDIKTKLRRHPFEPFRMVLSTGEGFGVRHPELLMVGKRSVTLGIAADPAETDYDHTVQIDMLHVVRLEPLPPTPAGGKS